MSLRLGNNHLAYQAFPNWPLNLSGFSMDSCLDFDLCQYGHISHEDIIFRIKYLEDSNDLIHLTDSEGEEKKIKYHEVNSLEAFQRIELFYCNNSIGKRLFKLDKIISKDGIFKLSDVFPGIKFNVYNSPTNKLLVRFRRNQDDYRFKEFSVEYNRNFNELKDIVKFEDSVSVKQQVSYYTKSGEQVKLYIQFKDGSLHGIQDTPISVYLNDEKLKSPYDPIVFSMPGKHIIILERPEDCDDFVYVQKIIGTDNKNIE